MMKLARIFIKTILVVQLLATALPFSANMKSSACETACEVSHACAVAASPEHASPLGVSCQAETSTGPMHAVCLISGHACQLEEALPPVTRDVREATKLILPGLTHFFADQPVVNTAAQLYSPHIETITPQHTKPLFLLHSVYLI